MTIRIISLIFITYLLTVYNGNASCVKDLDCDTKGSICVNSTCVCPLGFVLNSDKTVCLLVSTGYGGECEDNVQCSEILQTGGQCRNEKCQCASGFHYLRGQCIRSVGLGENCRNDDHCYSNYDFEATSCKDGKCQCSEGYYQREYSACRRISYAPGQPCGIAQDCHFKDAVCTMARVCDYKNTTQPTPPTLLELFLEENNIFDNTNIFKKQVNLINFNQNYQVKIGENCSTTEDCKSVEHSYCGLSKKCLCVQGYYSSDSRDACYPELGSPCSNDTDCKGRYTMCRNSTWCTCQQGFVANPNNRLCLKMSRNIGWSCLHDEQCSFFGMGGQCVHKKCACATGTHFQKSHLFCWRSQKIGEACLCKEDCWGDGKQCKGRKCKCVGGYHSADNGTTCRKNGKIPGDTCIEDSDCVFRHSVCLNGSCQCSYGYFNENNICLTGVGGKCLVSNDCQATNSKCGKGRFCYCPTNFVASTDNSICLEVVNNFGNECRENAQCSATMGTLAACIDGKCGCVQNSHFALENEKDLNSGRCYLDIKLGNICTKAAECIEINEENATVSSTSRAVCRKGVCRCDYQYRYDVNNNFCSDGGASFILPEVLLIITVITFHTVKYFIK